MVSQLRVKGQDYHPARCAEANGHSQAGMMLSVLCIRHCYECEYLGCADDLSEMDIHPAVTLHHVSIVCLAILQFHQLHSRRSFSGHSIGSTAAAPLQEEQLKKVVSLPLELTTGWP